MSDDGIISISHDSLKWMSSISIHTASTQKPLYDLFLFSSWEPTKCKHYKKNSTGKNWTNWRIERNATQKHVINRLKYKSLRHLWVIIYKEGRRKKNVRISAWRTKFNVKTTNMLVKCITPHNSLNGLNGNTMNRFQNSDNGIFMAFVVLNKSSRWFAYRAMNKFFDGVSTTATENYWNEIPILSLRTIVKYYKQFHTVRTFWKKIKNIDYWK